MPIKPAFKDQSWTVQICEYPIFQVVFLEPRFIHRPHNAPVQGPIIALSSSAGETYAGGLYNHPLITSYFVTAVDFASVDKKCT